MVGVESWCGPLEAFSNFQNLWLIVFYKYNWFNERFVLAKYQNIAKSIFNPLVKPLINSSKTSKFHMICLDVAYNQKWFNGRFRSPKCLKLANPFLIPYLEGIKNSK